MVIAGFMWHPEMLPMAYTMARTERPKAKEIPTKPMFFPAITALPQPMKTRTNVPMSSAMYFFPSLT